MTISIRTVACLAVGLLGVLVNFTAAAEPVEFNRDIRPILAETCLHCHGRAKQSGGLRLDQAEAALRPAESGLAAIVPGKPGESELVRRVFASDDDERMPPPKSNKTLKPAQKDLLQRWIAEGAKYQKHWSFEPPVMPTPPAAPGVAARNPIDAFIAARLAQSKLTMSPEADPATLIRRVSFTLTGLPPTPAEVEQFLSDKSEQAYGAMVDRYLASPRYGEEMARHWLDVARYADTHGLHLDNERQMWTYRDWVIRAFNENKPFDQFTIEQLAGDLLPSGTPDQLVATGFNRCNVSTGEGGSIEAEWLFRNAVDRASTTAETWLGLTAGCAVCHDHKYDPLSAKEFYSLYAFFYSLAGGALDGNKLLHEPVIKLISPAQEKQLAELDRQIAATAETIKRRNADVRYNDPAGTVIDDDDEPEIKPLAATKSIVSGAKSFADEVANSTEGAKQTAEDARQEEALKALAKDPEHSFQAWKKAGDKSVAKAAKEIKTLFAQVATKTSPKKPPADAEKRLLEYYLQNVCTDTKATFEPLLANQEKLTKQRTDLDASIPGAFVFKEADKPRAANVMVRGQYDKPGDPVEPNTPAILPPLKKARDDGRATRLDLARWLVSAEQPLTARVTVNRFWQQVFGVGLVRTSFDFGTQGEAPSHAELLDWLAVTFREQGWDVKSFVKLLVASATFRQASRVTPDMLAADPENRLYPRGPRIRLDAEQIRDNALFVSGLVDLTMGGKGMNSYQPPNIWEPVGFVGSNTRFYKQDTGSALYRRSIYMFLKRTAPAPFMANFDAPNREQFCAGRERNNTPMQALQLMNDVQHFEAARALAQRALVEGGAQPSDRLAFLWRVVLARAPESEELEIARQELDAHLRRFADDSGAARRVIAHGESKPSADLPAEELAAYTLVANMLLNLDETVTRN